MSPQDAARLVGHSSPQPEAEQDERNAIAWLDQFTPTAGWRHQVHTIKRMLAERERLRTALRAVRDACAYTDEKWARAHIRNVVTDALHEVAPAETHTSRRSALNAGLGADALRGAKP